ncbi:hypothetical protein BH10BAC4_BH10BAC4_01930 [soil metagenome]
MLINIKKTKNKLSHWLLTIVLLFSILSFSNGISNSSAGDRRMANSELRISNHVHYKRTISFTRAIQLSKFDFSFVFNQPYEETAFLHNLLLKVRLQHLTKLFLFAKRIGNESHLKTIPQNSDEDHLIR